MRAISPALKSRSDVAPLLECGVAARAAPRFRALLAHGSVDPATAAQGVVARACRALTADLAVGRVFHHNGCSIIASYLPGRGAVSAYGATGAIS